MEHAQALGAYVSAFMDELWQSGVRHLVFAPGSRSAPLALAAAEQKGLHLWRHIDERSAGFFALGLAKALGAPVALVCSSGTAAANFYPAVIEAYYDRVPLIVLTADRPHELRDSGAPQTIDQLRLYGPHVKWFADMALPEGGEAALRYVRQAAARAAAVAAAAPAGPVHLNFPFREPLIPQLPAGVPGGAASGGPHTAAARGRPVLPEDELAALADELASWRRGLIVCGPQRDPELAPAVIRLAERLGYPVLADPLSGVRYGAHGKACVIDAYDAFLRDRRFSAQYAPDVVLRFGAAPTSKALNQYLERHAGARQTLVDGGGGWRDPAHVVRRVVHADPAWLCEALAERLPGDLEHAGCSWLAAWQAINRGAKEAALAQVARFDALFEGRIFTELRELLPEGSVLYAGNSMPVRDMDAFLYARDAALVCHANRGANGIDGVVSSALGAAAARLGPTVLVIGDLSFYHDLNGLLAAKLHGLDLTVILVHNDGGGIFSFLPQADLPRHFEALFGTPHGLDFAPVVAMYGGTFRRAEDWPAFRKAVRTGLEQGGLHVIEVRTERNTNRTMHQAVWQAVAARVGELIGA